MTLLHNVPTQEDINKYTTPDTEYVPNPQSIGVHIADDKARLSWGKKTCGNYGELNLSAIEAHEVARLVKQAALILDIRLSASDMEVKE